MLCFCFQCSNFISFINLDDRLLFLLIDKIAFWIDFVLCVRSSNRFYSNLSLEIDSWFLIFIKLVKNTWIRWRTVEEQDVLGFIWNCSEHYWFHVCWFWYENINIELDWDGCMMFDVIFDSDSPQKSNSKSQHPCSWMLNDRCLGWLISKSVTGRLRYVQRLVSMNLMIDFRKSKNVWAKTAINLISFLIEVRDSKFW